MAGRNLGGLRSALVRPRAQARRFGGHGHGDGKYTFDRESTHSLSLPLSLCSSTRRYTVYTNPPKPAPLQIPRLI
jgi:hypothetical protein